MASTTGGDMTGTAARGLPRALRARFTWPRLWLVLLAALLLIALSTIEHRDPRGPITPDTPTTAAFRNAAEAANIVIIVIDAARADHLGCYGHPRPTTPTIDRLAAESITFTNHYCQIPMTAASTASLFTSQFPDTHGVFYRAPDDWQPPFTLAKALSKRGYTTALFSSNPSASPAVGIGCDFDHAGHRQKVVHKGGSFSPECLLVDVRNWLETNRDSRLFAYIHFLPPHTPYHQPDRFTCLFDDTPPGYAACDYTPLRCDFPITGPYHDHPHPALPDWINLYDANLRYADLAIGEVLDTLDAAGILDTTLLIITSDHGEAFGEHGYVWHVGAIHDEATHIPLLIKFPGSAIPSRRIDALTQTIDLLPTVCDLLRIPYPRDSVQGHSLLPLLSGLTDVAASHTIAKSIGPAKYMIRDRDYALLLFREEEPRALYDLRADPAQRINLITQRAERADQLLHLFRRHAQAQSTPPLDFLDSNAAPIPDPLPTGLPADITDDLTTLGYLR